ncbi:uncharacterized protein BJ212DRAFT_1304395 [Suillus subaureus]|uniref:Uncharacterized protein n=1 Tax=Suillus subaureus TaxID=48587 RepID=A0A9P7DVG9_9AGAM|nr:uncharacterized protein BJ212DRAFT_1304395 [Suillus subaureus]KAG1804182.1 hypothetical protein BJ212DRAFT_1304395 [Suillus subaureus]
MTSQNQLQPQYILNLVHYIVFDIMPCTGGKPPGPMMPMSGHYVADDIAMPFSSVLKDLIIVEYRPSMDRMDPDHAGNPHALAVHMHICWHMDICAKGLHNILAESFSLLATPMMPMNGLPLHKDTRSKLPEDAILSQERKRRTTLAQAIYSAKLDSQMVWRIMELVQALRIKVQHVKNACDAWDDDNLEGPRKAYVSHQMDTIVDLTSQLIIGNGAILRHCHMEFYTKEQAQSWKGRADKMESFEYLSMPSWLVNVCYMGGSSPDGYKMFQLTELAVMVRQELLLIGQFR